MIEYGQNHARLPFLILGQRSRPQIRLRGIGSWHVMFPLPARFEIPILMPSTQVCDIGLTDRHLISASPATVKGMGQGPAARLRYESFQFDDRSGPI
jgi:hypothetical protein